MTLTENIEALVRMRALIKELRAVAERMERVRDNTKS